MGKKWKTILISLFILPIIVFFPGCSCDDNGKPPRQIANLTYTVRFYTDSLETFNIASQIIQDGQLVRKPVDPIKNGYKFIGWYLDKDFQHIWTFEIDTVSYDMTLYARWQKRESI